MFIRAIDRNCLKSFEWKLARSKKREGFTFVYYWIFDFHARIPANETHKLALRNPCSFNVVDIFHLLPKSIHRERWGAERSSREHF